MELHGIDIILVGRVVERLLITISGLLTIVMGWNLFRAGVIDAQSFDFAKDKDFSIKVAKIGPGVLFAFFGISIFAINLLHPITIQPSEQVGEAHSGADKGKTGQSSITFYGNSDKEKLELAKAINTVRNNLKQATESTPERKKKSDAALEVLEDARDGMMLEKFGAEKVKLFAEKEGIYITRPSELSESERGTISEMMLWKEKTL